jgi:hypothetical protein
VEYRSGFLECSDCHVPLASGEPPDISLFGNRELRSVAAALVIRYCDREITNDQFEDGFGQLWRWTDDRAVKAIYTAIWTTYSDLREQYLDAGYDQSSELVLFFERCILFLKSDLPYEWERDNFIGLAPFTPIFRALSKAAKKISGNRPLAGLRCGPDSKEDWKVWPFKNESDFLRVRAELNQCAEKSEDSPEIGDPRRRD